MPSNGAWRTEGAMVWFMPWPRAATGRVMGETWYMRMLATSVWLIAEGSASRGARAALLGPKT
jgi:hypothetical protein